jgi:eukaryotic-like serine/threonine-protein kinase
VPIYEVGEHEGQQYYSMKLVEGTQDRSDPRREVEALIGVIRAVHHAHQRGVLHRDLKPSNVLVDSQGTRMVADFGLAKRMAAGDGSFTETGQALGTPKYMAPEQAAGRKDLSVAADVYSLAVILYERLTGQTPFTGDNALTLLRQARESEPPRPSTIRPGLDRDLETVVLKCLEKEPDRRYPSAEALADDVANWLAGRPISARPVGQAERFWRWCQRNPVVACLTITLAVSLLVCSIISTYFASQANQRAKAERAQRERTNELLLEARHKLIDADVDRALAIGSTELTVLELARAYRAAL